MKLHHIVAGGAVALAAGGAAHAQTVPSGYVGVGYAYNSSDNKFTDISEGSDFGKFDTKSSGYYFDGAIALPVTGPFGVQVDLSYQNGAISFDETFNNSTSHDHFGYHPDGTTATAHVFDRMDKYLVGVFVGQTDSGFGSLKGGGIEGQYYMGPWTFEGSLGAGSATFDEPFDAFKPYAIAVRAEARYFVNPNLVVGVHTGYMDGTTRFHESGGFHEDFQGPGLWTVGVGAEYKMPSQPFSFTLNYEHGDGNSRVSDNEGFSEHDKLTGDTVLVGVRWNFGGSLLDRDRHGPSLDTFKEMFGGDFGNNFLFEFEED